MKGGRRRGDLDWLGVDDPSLRRLLQQRSVVVSRSREEELDDTREVIDGSCFSLKELSLGYRLQEPQRCRLVRLRECREEVFLGRLVALGNGLWVGWRRMILGE